MDLNGSFWTMFAAVLIANLLTVSFVYGMVQYSKAEREKREDSVGFPIYSAIVMPLALLVLCVYSVLF